MLRLVFIFAAISVTAAPLRTANFDHDPGWDGYNNHVTPTKVRRVHQDFGWATNKIGGDVQRSTTPASYALALAPAKTLQDPLSASGDFTIQEAHASGGVFFGFFNSHRPAGSGRPIGSLGMNFDFESSGGRLMTLLINSSNQSCGTFITPYLPGKYRPTPLRKDGTRYHWTLHYDPNGANGNGQFTFSLTGGEPPGPVDASLTEDAQKEARARYPYTTNFSVDVPAGYKKAGATFDRFGLCDAMKFGSVTTIFFDHLTLDGAPLDLSADPHWVGEGNHDDFADHEITGAHWFGYSPNTHYAGGNDGEVGGLMWRGGDFAYYADRVGPLDLTQKLEARGRVELLTAAPDSDVCLGWFNSAAKTKDRPDAENFVGIHIGGPTRVGHYFAPVMATAAGHQIKVKRASVLVPGQAYEWSMIYDPSAHANRGELRVTLGGQTTVCPLKPGQKAEGAMLDRFGLFTIHHSGGMVKIYLDDLSYSATR